MEVTYVASSEAIKEVTWLRKFFMELGVTLFVIPPMILFSHNNGLVT